MAAPAEKPVVAAADRGAYALEPLPALASISAEEIGWPGDASVDARVERLENLGEEKSREIIRATLQMALGDADPDVRREALRQIALLPNNLAAPLLAELLKNEPVAAIRNQALEKISDWKGPEAVPVLAVAIQSPHMDTKLIASSQLPIHADKPALEVLFTGLKDRDLGFRERINDGIENLIDRRFQSYEEAEAWWAAHNKEFDAKLFRL